MPADRFIHPRLGHSAKVCGLSDLEFRCWVQYLLSADDFGVMRASAVTLQAANDALEARPSVDVAAALNGLIEAGLVRVFDHQDRRYVCQLDWQAWQKVSYPRGTDNPKPHSDLLALCNAETRELFALHPGGKGRSRNVSETFSEHSENVSSKTPTTRAGVRAKRLTANGIRLTASGEGVRGEDAGFAAFWSAYPAKARKAKLAAQKAWAKIRPDDALLATMLSAIAAQQASRQWREGFIPHASTWLNGRRWEDEVEPDTPAPAKGVRTVAEPAWLAEARAAQARLDAAKASGA